MSQLGCGTYGQVYKVVKNEQVFARKLFKFNIGGCDLPLELDIMNRIQSYYLNRSLGVELVAGDHLAVDMYLAKSDLNRFIRTSRTLLPLGIAINFMWSLTQAVKTLHNYRILHLDIKPENVLVFEVGGGQLFVQLADFGLAMIAHRQSDGFLYRHSYRKRLTRRTAAPENFLGSNDYTAASDIWSLGVVFLFILSGELLIKDAAGPNVLEHLSTMLNDETRLENIKRWIKYDGPKADLAADLINKILNPNIMFRIRIDNIISHPLFAGMTFYNPVVSSPSITDKFDPIVNQYSGLFKIIQVCESYDYLVETLFLAVDIYYRALSYDIGRNNYISLSVASLWIAIKVIGAEKEILLDHLIGTFGDNTINSRNVVNIENDIIIRFGGIIYRYNLFTSSENTDQLLINFYILINITKYLVVDNTWVHEDVSSSSLTKMTTKKLLEKVELWSVIKNLWHQAAAQILYDKSRETS